MLSMKCAQNFVLTGKFNLDRKLKRVSIYDECNVGEKEKHPHLWWHCHCETHILKSSFRVRSQDTCSHAHKHLCKQADVRTASRLLSPRNFAFLANPWINKQWRQCCKTCENGARRWRVCLTKHEQHEKQFSRLMSSTLLNLFRETTCIAKSDTRAWK